MLEYTQKHCEIQYFQAFVWARRRSQQNKAADGEIYAR